MKALLPLLWLAQLFDFLSRPQPEPRRTLIRVVGLVVLMLGVFLATNVSVRLLPEVPVVSVAAALLGLFVAFIGFAMMMTSKKV